MSVELWETAGAALEGRMRKGRGSVRHAPTLTQPTCGACYGEVRPGAPSGVSPMYRVFVGKKGHRIAYFRCNGHGPERSSCGAALIPVEDVDARTRQYFSTSPWPHMTRVFIPGRDVAAERREIEVRMTSAQERRAWADVGALAVEAEALDRAEDVRASWSTTPTVDAEGRPVSTGQHFASLDALGQRDYVAEGRRILAERIKDDEGQPVLVMGEHVEDSGALFRWAEPGEVVQSENRSLLLNIMGLGLDPETFPGLSDDERREFHARWAARLPLP